QQATGIIIVILVTGLLWIFIFLVIAKRRNKTMKKNDVNVLEKVCGIIEDLRVETDENVPFRCWSCFKEIDRSLKLCHHCGEQQN
ncbi:MAG: hypothetical protein ACC656_12270, partial [Candidatus Heimdallarchaeota archaeon]